MPCRTSIAIVASIFAAGLSAGGCNDKHKQEVAEAIAMTGGDPARGREIMDCYGCKSCHTIPGVYGADAVVGPPLERMGSRVYIAGVLTNTPEHMVQWLRNPPGIDPKTAMPNLHLSDQEARDAACYLYTLR